MSENEKLNRKLEEAHKSANLLSLGINLSPRLIIYDLSNMQTGVYQL